MIDFFSETDFKLKKREKISKWIQTIIDLEGCSLGEISYVFCDDTYLHAINVAYLKHDTLTDIISFDYSVGKQLHGEIYISIERVTDNAKDYGVSFEKELMRVLIHGVLHFIGYTDKTEEDKELMRKKEDESLAIFKK
ncbi:MAG: rRNA maturation RNase YbeY [Flavobacteriaceae bacterium CG_4_8_14_3_um_filter_34_10]|nr:rRNA maturation RNase YbeY [Flavobacteriia bacterium]OIP52103.1 MAG: rRNA maturation RNase YbeY [Flavobacteriaceae bacterium CG2_30_34_30]PIQ19355.1 MAG: rRNA maturation RNase YbeY [Flavobacteriaceae bacterium CG18_big_fil_WC_8_21_14_2_50_34_36]PIV49193.1 MAG: rRNA maturation RNase YbeY [Flavobacteriaceae bacterium CG02_land_8_20_14_3_00_34_13]PIX09694.1 MAG: rRNA maturation RNase YbeY [Flavobacteriaceae bacterium CG_4_8_14_3_um_filter_34_10]PIZ08611.1 MAG: rRNA maturation RNase YbeY [Flavo